MAVGRAGKTLMGPILMVNFVVYLIVLGLAGWSVDKFIDGEQDHPHLGGNTSTGFVMVFSLMGGAIGACSLLSGLIHLRAWQNDSLASASSSAIIAWAITALAFGVCGNLIAEPIDILGAFASWDALGKASDGSLIDVKQTQLQLFWFVE
ncbi:OLC1v1010768C1 [Oldenlandia corymbosa var. corymbosa]|uniref:OLC1v1010768C1 n=1 Tax=Oldenlandia corymbosa var. corymbosa TaxID=529605 RepID=A0AAV1DS26_OLDCO|nr:OLC1v1010768C1 [Oldenlandia corymbosa var. corymbosa]